MFHAIDVGDEILDQGAASFLSVRQDVEMHPVTCFADVGDFEAWIIKLIGLVVDEWMRVGVVVEGSSPHFLVEVGLIEVSGMGFVAAGAEDVNFVKIVVTVPGGVAVESCVDTVDQHATVGDFAFKDIVFVAVFDEKILFIAQRNHIAIAATAFPRDGFQLVGAEGVGFSPVDYGDLVHPVAVFVFHVGAGLLGWLGGAAHQIPRAYGVDAIAVMVQVGSAQRVEHLVAEGADVEITAFLQL